MTLCRALAEEDVQGSSSSVREAAGAEGNAVMPQGALKESGLSSTDAYLTRKAGMYCDVVERLARNHLEVSKVTIYPPGCIACLPQLRKVQHVH